MGCILGYVVLYLPGLSVVAKGHISVLLAGFTHPYSGNTQTTTTQQGGFSLCLLRLLAGPLETVCSNVEYFLWVQSAVDSSGGAFTVVTLGLAPGPELSEGEVGVGAAVIAMVVASGLATAVPSAFSAVFPS